MKKTILLLVIMLMGCNDEDVAEIINNEEVVIVEEVNEIKTGYNRIAFIGNSITEHGISPTIGWHCKCGMAATSEKNDFDNIVTEYFNAEQLIVIMGLWEQDFNSDRFESFLDLYFFQPDLIIVNLGENVKELKLLEKDFVYEFERMHFELMQNTAAKIIYVDSFLKVQQINNLFDEFAVKNNIELVKISDLNLPEHKAIDHENVGVASHPNDSGHYEIAQRIILAVDN